MISPSTAVATLALALGALAATACATLASDPEASGTDVTASEDPTVIARGRYLVHGPAHCAECHATPGDPTSAGLGGGRVFDLAPLGRFVAANLGTDRDVGLGGWSDAEIARVLRTGRTRSGRQIAPLMQYESLSDADLQAVLSYLRTLPSSPRSVPQSEPSLLGRFVLSARLLAERPRLAHDATRGEYLADAVANCDACHTRRSFLTGRQSGHDYSGGMRLREHDREYVAPDISRTGIAGRLDEQAFVALFRAARDRAPGSPMPWHAYASMTRADLESIYGRLRESPP